MPIPSLFVNGYAAYLKARSEQARSENAPARAQAATPTIARHEAAAEAAASERRASDAPVHASSVTLHAAQAQAASPRAVVPTTGSASVTEWSSLRFEMPLADVIGYQPVLHHIQQKPSKGEFIGDWVVNDESGKFAYISHQRTQHRLNLLTDGTTVYGFDRMSPGLHVGNLVEHMGRELWGQAFLRAFGLEQPPPQPEAEASGERTLAAGVHAPAMLHVAEAAATAPLAVESAASTAPDARPTSSNEIETPSSPVIVPRDNDGWTVSQTGDGSIRIERFVLGNDDAHPRSTGERSCLTTVAAGLLPAVFTAIPPDIRQGDAYSPQALRSAIQRFESPGHFATWLRTTLGHGEGMFFKEGRWGVIQNRDGTIQIEKAVEDSIAEGRLRRERSYIHEIRATSGEYIYRQIRRHFDLPEGEYSQEALRAAICRFESPEAFALWNMGRRGNPDTFIDAGSWSVKQCSDGSIEAQKFVSGSRDYSIDNLPDQTYTTTVPAAQVPVLFDAIHGVPGAAYSQEALRTAICRFGSPEAFATWVQKRFGIGEVRVIDW